MIDRVAVVIPARDEEAGIGACLLAVQRSRARLVVSARESGRPSPRVLTVVVLDACTDGTAGIVLRAAERPGSDVVVLETDAGSVGVARSTGVDAALLALGSPEDPDGVRTWIANTDADSEVPTGWLSTHLDLADRGADAVVGTVVPRLGELDEQRRAAWIRDRPHGSTPGDVHGANLGVRADAYRAVGGFAAVPEHEDVSLVAAIARSGRTVLSTDAAPVLTSARLVGRTPSGYAGFLDRLLEPDEETASRISRPS